MTATKEVVEKKEAVVETGNAVVAVAPVEPSFEVEQVVGIEPKKESSPSLRIKKTHSPTSKKPFSTCVLLLVLGILLIIAAGSSQVVYVMSTNLQKSNFEDAYNEAANDVIQQFYEKIKAILYDAKGLSDNLVRNQENADWPFVYFTDYGYRCDASLRSTRADTIALLPLIKDADRKAWETYLKGVYLSAAPYPTSASIAYRPTGRSITQGIYAFNGTRAFDAVQSENYLPVSQISPRLDKDYTDLVGTLFDESTSNVRGKGLSDSIDRNGAVFSSFLFLASEGSDYAFFKEPRFSMLYPVRQQAEVKAVLDFQIDLANLIGEGNDSDEVLTVVVSNTCSEDLFSYEVGDYILFLGEGDRSDPSVLKNKIELQESSEDLYTIPFGEHGVRPISEDMCRFKLQVYPTQEFRDLYFNNQPNIYRAIVFGVFALIICLFAMFGVYALRQRGTPEVNQSQGSESFRSAEESKKSDSSTMLSMHEIGSPSMKPINSVEILAPPGPLGLRFGTSPHGAEIISINEDSPLRGSVAVGDTIISVAGHNLKGVPPSSIPSVLKADTDKSRTVVIVKKSASPSKAKEQSEIVAPRGNLALTLETSSEGAVIVGIEDGSPLKEKVSIGDIITTVDTTCLKGVPQTFIPSLLHAKSDQDRKLIVLRGK